MSKQLNSDNAHFFLKSLNDNLASWLEGIPELSKQFFPLMCDQNRPIILPNPTPSTTIMI
jgi:hypothetical protein